MSALATGNGCGGGSDSIGGLGNVRFDGCGVATIASSSGNATRRGRWRQPGFRHKLTTIIEWHEVKEGTGAETQASW